MNESRFFTALITGLAAGAVLGILFAPDKGSETRRRISSSARDLSDKGKDMIDHLKERAGGHNHNGHGKKARHA